MVYKKYKTINCRGKLVDFNRPKIMGILNITPDSFSDGGKYNSEIRALRRVEEMIDEGVDIIDIGAQSTRPKNADKISAGEEMIRIGNLISTIKKHFPEVLVSLDTFYGEVVSFGYNEGIDIVNDISAGQFDSEMLPMVAKVGLPYVLMHINPNYHSMHKKNIENDIILEINYFFSKKIKQLLDLGIKDIILDPGFGFGKTIEQQEQLIAELEYIDNQGLPMLVGISRKSFIYKPLGKSPLEIEDEIQTLHKQILNKGADILRVHDVGRTREIIGI